MAVNYSVPPWLRGASPMEAVVPGASLGQRIFESNQRSALDFLAMQNQQQQFAQRMEQEQERLQAQQEIAQQKLASDQQIAQQEAMRDQQKLQIENSYKQAQLGLAKQKLDLTTQVASQKFQAQQQFLAQRDMLKSGFIYEEGMDPAEAEQKATTQALFMFGPQMGMSPNALAQLARSATGPGTVEPETRTVTTDQGDVTYLLNPKTGHTQVLDKPTPEPRFQVRPGMSGRPGRITGVTGVSPEQLAQFGITNQYNFGKKKSAPVEAAKPDAASPYKDGARLRKGNDLYEVRGGLPVLIQKNAFSEQTSTSPEHPSDEE